MGVEFMVVEWIQQAAGREYKLTGSELMSRREMGRGVEQGEMSESKLELVDGEDRS